MVVIAMIIAVSDHWDKYHDGSNSFDNSKIDIAEVKKQQLNKNKVHTKHV